LSKPGFKGFWGFGFNWDLGDLDDWIGCYGDWILGIRMIGLDFMEIGCYGDWILGIRMIGLDLRPHWGAKIGF